MAAREGSWLGWSLNLESWLEGDFKESSDSSQVGLDHLCDGEEEEGGDDWIEGLGGARPTHVLVRTGSSEN